MYCLHETHFDYKDTKAHLVLLCLFYCASQILCFPQIEGFVASLNGVSLWVSFFQQHLFIHVSVTFWLFFQYFKLFTMIISVMVIRDQ